MRPDKVITIDPREGDTLSVVGDNYRLLITGKQTEGSFSVIDMLIPPGGGPGPHAHAAFQESFYVVEGEIVVRSETQHYTARKGSFVSIPRGGAIHSFRNESDGMAHILCIVVAAGLEDFFRKIGEPVGYNEFLPAPEITPEMGKKLKEVAEESGQELFPPAYLDGVK